MFAVNFSLLSFGFIFISTRLAEAKERFSSRHNEAILFRLADLLQDEAGHFHQLLFHLVATDAGLASHFNVVLNFGSVPEALS